ncbi:hypothetical protein ACIBP6_08670 [Nonomuraea terrae]|uniref:hypothetical protein n=1 Tax=Nonomuraea terrae TaxID=2530383 RepID=UPI0037A6A253
MTPERILAEYPDDTGTVLFLARRRDDVPQPVVELVERHRSPDPARSHDHRKVVVPVAALGVAVPYFEQRLGPVRRTGGLADRLIACWAVLAGRRTPRELDEVTGFSSRDPVTLVAAYCVDAGISHELMRDWDGATLRRIRRHVLLRTPPEPGGYHRHLVLEIGDRDGREGRVEFLESYRLPGSPVSPHTVTADCAALDPLVAVLETRLGLSRAGDLEHRLVDAFTTAIERGELGAHLPFRLNRDRVRAWFEEAGLTCRLDGPRRHHDLLRTHELPGGGSLFLSLDVRTVEGRPRVEFGQMYAPADRRDDGRPERGSVLVALTWLDPLVAFLRRSLGLPARPGTEDDLFDCFTALAERGDLGAAPGEGRSPQDNAGQVAAWCAAAGVPHELRGERTRTLLKAYRDGAGCLFTLTVSLDTRVASAPAVRLTAVRFHEHYDYAARVGDGGREYVYGVALSHVPAEPLADVLERRLGVRPDGQDTDERLIRCLNALVERGELGAGLPLRANRDRVAALFADLGEVTTDSWNWFGD